ncbi:hypothetical protein GCM10025869_24590 [Homoserinibacter gongjuensis]|uniref:Uncharacterized protein n=1 Tax=Homoserinibacter gongjuensis TaxID=1162968 RepID=A0ABQ6JYR1_9MICO|nr:hypothetical protein [Homoserinibacter gongjuensis]GMA91930.1 hypothetical protein GCM10025869_24590 [Homoserinibacter gongjuensis]
MGFEVGLGDEDAHGRFAVTQECSVVDARTDADEFDEHVEGELLGGALVADDVFGALGGIRVDEAGAASAGEVAASNVGTTIAADSGSSRPWKLVEPSGCVRNFRYRLSRSAFSRAGMPARSSSSRARAASAARVSSVDCGAAAISSFAAAVRSSSAAPSAAAARRVRMTSAAPTEIAAEATASAITVCQRGAGGCDAESSRVEVGRNSAAFTSV